jgi:hypothetical protein
MRSATKDKEYKSSVRKLARFFEKSRDQWKAKCREAKRMIRLLKSRIRFLEKSRERWRQKAREMEQKLTEAEARERELKEKLEAVKEEGNGEATEADGPAEFAVIPRGHQYSVGQVKMFADLVLSDGSSLRCAERAIERMMTSLQLTMSVPSWYAGRLWILRLGYYKLTRPKERGDDWVWIVDHTVQIGAEKCLVILGVRLSVLPAMGECLSHEDVEPIALWPVKKSNGDVVHQQLEAGIEKTGIPREIMSDHGTDLKSGIDKFCQTHHETCAVYDIKHQTAALLKHELDDEPIWNEFVRLAGRTKRQVQQTPLAALSPPNQRTKARYMNVDVLIHWGRDTLDFLDRAEESTMFEAEQVEEKLGWITRFRQPLKEWEILLQVVVTTESYIRQRGLYQDIHLELEQRLQPLARTEQARRVCVELTAFVAQEAAKARPHERLLGSSEIIESVLGKLKRLEQDQSKSGFTGLLLALCATVATTTTDVIHQALETVPTNAITAWCRENLGQSVQAKRRRVFASQETEQKRNQSWGLA